MHFPSASKEVLDLCEMPLFVTFSVSPLFFRSILQTGISLTFGPPHHPRLLPDPHAPLPGDCDRNMDHHKEQREVGGTAMHFSAKVADFLC